MHKEQPEFQFVHLCHLIKLAVAVYLYFMIFFYQHISEEGTFSFFFFFKLIFDFRPWESVIVQSEKTSCETYIFGQKLSFANVAKS